MFSDEPNSYYWPFTLDKVHDYAYWNNFLSKEECEKIILIGKSKQLDKGNTFNNNKEKTRDSNISWLSPHDDLFWLYKKLTDTVKNLNDRYFGFDLYGFTEGLQFTNYKAPAGKYDSHIDRAYNSQIRKLSITIQLSDPNDYKGGDFELINDNKPIIFEKQQGKLFLFPSYILHRVTPVTKGERNSLVTWITGPNFK
jgi:PKHD-type hydroxylase